MSEKLVVQRLGSAYFVTVPDGDVGRRVRFTNESDAHLFAAAGMLRDALEEIAKGEGPYSRDPLTHADACIESMKSIANAILAAAKPPEETK